MKNVELVLSNTFVYKGKIFEKGKTYGVSDGDARHLVAQKTERDIPYFRLTDAGSPVAPAARKGAVTPAVVADEKTGDPVVESEVVVAEEPEAVATDAVADDDSGDGEEAGETAVEV